ncbi:MAG: MFS transporter [Planctomycetaceae bacterium]|nr:MAG: MFS transporter [Planctomycetaceae bacterium]
MPDQQLDSASGRRAPWLVLLALCLTATVAYVQRQCLGTVEREVREDLGLSRDAMAHVLSAFFITYAALQVPAGRVAQMFGTRRALSAMVILWSIASGLVSLVNGLTGLVTCRLALGVGQAGIFTCTTLSVRNWFPAHRFALANGMVAAFMQVGGVLGAALAGLLTLHLGWRTMFLVFAVPGLLWGAWFWYWFRDSPNDDPGALPEGLTQPPSLTPVEPARAVPTPWAHLLWAWPLWCLCGQQFFRAAAQMFYSSWFATYLKEARGVGLAESGALNSLPIAAAALGPLAGGWVSDLLQARTGDRRVSRQGLSVACLLICAALVLLGYRATSVHLAVVIISLGSFFAAAAGPAAYTMTIDFGGRWLAPVFALMNMWGNIGAAAFPYVVPRLTRGRAADDWNEVFLLFALLYVLAACCWIPFNSTRPLSLPDQGDRAASG